MKLKRFLLCTALLALIAGSASIASAAHRTGTAVSVRVEGRTHTLRPAKVVQTHGGSITRYGAPRGACPANSGMGALDVATNNHWKGTWYSAPPDYFITSILGESYGAKAKYFWELFVNNRAAQTGACEIKLHPGDQLLFAAVPLAGFEYPLVVDSPTNVGHGQHVNIHVAWIDGKGRSHALARARVHVGKQTFLTNSRGVVRFVATRVGTFRVGAEKSGYVRAATVVLKVTQF